VTEQEIQVRLNEVHAHLFAIGLAIGVPASQPPAVRRWGILWR
jgi:hypothetical protein